MVRKSGSNVVKEGLDKGAIFYQGTEALEKEKTVKKKLLVVAAPLVVIGIAVLIGVLRTPNSSASAEKVLRMHCETTLPLGLYRLLNILSSKGQKAGLGLDLVEGTPRDKLVQRWTFDLSEEEVFEADLGPPQHSAEKEELIIYERHEDGVLIAAHASLANWMIEYTSGEKSSPALHRFAYDLPYKGGMRAQAGQRWNLVILLWHGRTEVAFPNTTCEKARP